MDYLYKIYGWRYVGGIEMVAKTPYKDKAYSIANNLDPEEYHQYMIIEHDNKKDMDCPIARQTLYKTQGRVLKRGGRIMYNLFIKIMYEQDFRKYTIQELEEIKGILEEFKGRVLEVKLKRIKEENGISYKKEKKE